MNSAAPTENSSLFRKVIVATVFMLTNILAWDIFNNPGDLASQEVLFGETTAVLTEWLSVLQLDDGGMKSGVGYVTKDGLWDETPPERYKDADIKILGFSDKNYLPIAKIWYTRMMLLGYTEHYVVAHDEQTYDSLNAEGYRVIPCIIKNPDYSHPIKGIWQQIMSARLHLTMDMLKNGTHLLITDIDNVFSRHVPLWGFLEEGYDVYHAFEMRYPMHIYRDYGFVICSGHQFLRSSPEAIAFMEVVMRHCRHAKCDDQVTYNNVFFTELNIRWDGMDNPDREGAIRVNTTHPENSNLLVESVTGRSPVTNHTVKIWDRDFAWRLAGAIPEFCPSMNNWLGMPTKLDDSLTGPGNKLYKKIVAFNVW
eukprot:CAMPEP_0183730976 /NCGR_PEP_ID=MMETSP0737-20130205/33989_1 /TAXON_ID=385413 /ORGANISM="Thalassiosira miniscula, Strain CCMP1093" /LENGTH=366 /DNA_ID=CAMNT_0025963585 /DNA_START=80 /DNA_END=1177 /DNA_ORIENTATION=-